MTFSAFPVHHLRASVDAVAVALAVGLFALAGSVPGAAADVDGSASASPGMVPVSSRVVAAVLSQNPQSQPARCFRGEAARSDHHYVVIVTRGGPCAGVYADGWSLYRKTADGWSDILVAGFPGQPSSACRAVRPRIPASVLRDLRAGRYCMA